MNLLCSFCIHYSTVDTADKVVIYQGHSICLPHFSTLATGDEWLLVLAKLGPKP